MSRGNQAVKYRQETYSQYLTAAYSSPVDLVEEDDEDEEEEEEEVGDEVARGPSYGERRG